MTLLASFPLPCLETSLLKRISPNILLTEENTVSATHLDPYLTLAVHLSKFFSCCSTIIFLEWQQPVNRMEFFLTL